MQRRIRKRIAGRQRAIRGPTSKLVRAPCSRSISRRSRLVGRPAPGSRAAGRQLVGGAGGGVRSSNRPRAISAEPRRSAKPITLSTRTAVERDRDDVAGTHRPARRIDARAVEPDMAGVDERGGGRCACAPRARATAICRCADDPSRREQALSAAPCCNPGLRAAPSAPAAWRTANSDRAPCRARSVELQVRDGRLSSPRSRSRSRRPRRGGRSPLARGTVRRSRSPLVRPCRRRARALLAALGACLADPALAAIAAAVTRTAVTLLALAVGRRRGVGAACRRRAATAALAGGLAFGLRAGRRVTAAAARCSPSRGRRSPGGRPGRQTSIISGSARRRGSCSPAQAQLRPAHAALGARRFRQRLSTAASASARPARPLTLAPAASTGAASAARRSGASVGACSRHRSTASDRRRPPRSRLPPARPPPASAGVGRGSPASAAASPPVPAPPASAASPCDSRASAGSRRSPRPTRR